MSRAIPCSVNILTHNSAETLEAALRSVESFAERLICDGWSTDGTIAIAIAHGCGIFYQDPRYTDDSGRLRDYAGARSQLLDASTSEWILYLDSDEILSPDAPSTIHEAITARGNEDIGAFRLRAEHVIHGVRVRDGIGYPMRMERLFRRSALQGFTGFINEHAKLAPGYRVDDIDASFLIPLPPLRVVLRKWARYVLISAHEARLRGACWTSKEVAFRRSAARWTLQSWIESRRRGTSHRMPSRYELARVAFALVQYGAVAIVRVFQKLTASR